MAEAKLSIWHRPISKPIVRLIWLAPLSGVLLFALWLELQPLVTWSFHREVRWEGFVIRMPLGWTQHFERDGSFDVEGSMVYTPKFSTLHIARSRYGPRSEQQVASDWSQMMARLRVPTVLASAPLVDVEGRPMLCMELLHISSNWSGLLCSSRDGRWSISYRGTSGDQVRAQTMLTSILLQDRQRN